jgi:hypothetical protein
VVRVPLEVHGWLSGGMRGYWIIIYFIIILENANCIVEVILNIFKLKENIKCEISSSHSGEYDVQSCLLGYYGV